MIRYFASHPTAANLLMLIFIVMGLQAFPTLRRETFPDFTAREVEVRVEYPGATAEEVEEAVCQRIEDAVDGVSFVKEVRSEAVEGLGKVIIEMQEGANFQVFLDDVRTEVEAIDDFPEEAEEPVIKQLGTTDQVVSIAVTGPMSLPDLKAYSEQLKGRLQQLPEVSLVMIQGFSDHQIRIEIPAYALVQHGLSIEDIAKVIARQSVDLPSGTIKTSERDVLIRFADQRRSPKEFEDLIVVAASSGAELRLGDIATVKDLFELDEEKIILNGQRAAVLQITKTKSEDTLQVIDAVNAFVEREKQMSPPGVEFVLTQDFSSIVRDRLRLLVVNGYQGLALVVLTMWLFFGFRFSFWVAIGLPVSFLGALFFMAQLGYSINLITMVGLLLALGLLMDDAIVISERVATHFRQGKAPLQAAIDGTSEVKRGVLSSFLTTICVFGSLAFMEGNIGKVLKVMPVVLILVLAVSLVEAFWILPNHLSHSLHHVNLQETSWFRRRFDDVIAWLQERVLGRTVDFAIGWRYLFSGLVIMVFVLSIGMVAGGRLKFQAFPEIDGDVIVARILLPQGTPLRRTEIVVKHITEALARVNSEFTARQPGKQSLLQNVIVQYNLNADAYETGPHVATVFVDLLSAERRNARIDDVLNRWREEVGKQPDVLNLKFAEPQFGPAGLPIDIRLQGNDLAKLKEASLATQAWLGSFGGVSDLSDDLRPGKPEIQVRLREGSMALGLDAATIATQLRAAFHGKEASEIQVGPESYEIDVRLASTDQNSLGDLEYFHVTLADGKQVPIGAVASLEFGRGFARIARVDGLRTVSVQGEVDTKATNTAEVIRELKDRFLPDLKKRYPSIQVSLEGEAKESEITGSSLRRAFLVGVIGVFILLSFQFKSYIEPLVVMVAIPFALIGVIWGHLYMGLALSMPSVVGFVSLAGVVVNDSILLVEFVKRRQREGESIGDAARLASRERFRAVLLTTLTTIAGLLPLLAEKSLQAQILIPLATSVVFGLAASTILVLCVIPSFYAILGDFGLLSKPT